MSDTFESSYRTREPSGDGSTQLASIKPASMVNSFFNIVALLWVIGALIVKHFFG